MVDVDRVQSEVDAANERLARVEQIRKFTVLSDDSLSGGDELTSTMKRKPIAEKYADEIERMYAGWGADRAARVARSRAFNRLRQPRAREPGYWPMAQAMDFPLFERRPAEDGRAQHRSPASRRATSAAASATTPPTPSRGCVDGVGQVAETLLSELRRSSAGRRLKP
jgi:hypothetical protein